MTQDPQCPTCSYEFTYEKGEGDIRVCPECSHEWSPSVLAASATPEHASAFVVKDANGTVLQDGDSVTVIKDLKVKGSTSGIKVGTKVKNIRLIDDGDHNIDCRVEGIGAMQLKSEFVRKN